MKIEPTYTSVGALFPYKPIFYIPKYQRSYAWNEEQVTDFISDLRQCIDKRSSNSPINHFFGGILSVRHPVTGAVNQSKYEIIDGQQRIATVCILVSNIIIKYGELREEVEGNVLNIINTRINELTERFIEFSQEINMNLEIQETLTLSKADATFFGKLIRNETPDASRNSHILLRSAFNEIGKVVDDVDAETEIDEKLSVLKNIQDIIEEDFTILHMITDNRDDAFRLFQVINDRGTSLTDGDLLRARTLEISEGFDNEQNSIEETWDFILSDAPDETANYLNWIYESHNGKRAKKNTLFDTYLDGFFPEHRILEPALNDIRRVKDGVSETYKELLKCKRLIQGQWLHQEAQPVTSWDRTRLSLLIVELNHTMSIPLLIAASFLDHRKFSEIVQMLEKAFFRYKIICNQHEAPLKNIYAEECIIIRTDPDNYNCNSLREKLRSLIENRASDESFSNSLSLVGYNEGRGSNKPLKYFLMSCEYYFQWYLNDAQGTPQCMDKSRVYDFSGTSIEHVYPKNAIAQDKVEALELKRHTLGNLTMMDPAQNTIGGNQTYETKRELYTQSSVLLTSNIALNGVWGEDEINAHKDQLLSIALAVFVV